MAQVKMIKIEVWASLSPQQEDHPLWTNDFINFKAYCLCIMKGQLGGQRSRLSSSRRMGSEARQIPSVNIN